MKTATTVRLIKPLNYECVSAKEENRSESRKRNVNTFTIVDIDMFEV